MGSNRRLYYIDNAKGLLIICVVLGHIPYALRLLGKELPYVCFPLNETMFIYVGIYMQAFFMLSGYTSNFDKPFLTFLIRNVKGIIVPCFALGSLAQILNYILIGNYSPSVFLDGFFDFLFCENLWFLWAMFCARLIYWPVCHFIRNKIFQGIVMMGILVAGIILNHICVSNSLSYLYKNYCFYRTAMCLGVFLWLGDMLKTIKLSDKVSLTIGLMYVPLIITSKFIPFVSPVSFAGSGGVWTTAKYHRT